MSPILVRPVREQSEHDRVIKALQTRLRRRYEVAVNMGREQAAPVRAGRLTLYPDLVLTSTGRGHRLAGIVEVESPESVNNLEAMAQWTHFGRARVAFFLYVPAGSVDMARRLCADNQVTVSELWSYHSIGSQIRFTLVDRAPGAVASRAERAPTRPPRKRPAASRRKTTTRKGPTRARAVATKVGTIKKASRSQKRK